MKSSQSNSKWWLAAIVLPILCVGIGFIAAFLTPFDQDDWLGLRRVVPVFAGLFIGCALCCITAIISLLRKESASGIALILAVPSLIFVIYVSCLWISGQKAYKRQQIINAVNYKKEQEKSVHIGEMRDKLRANPTLITSDDFWAGQKSDPDNVAKWGLDWLLGDKSFEVTPQIRGYVMTNFPEDIADLFLYGRTSHEELCRIVKDESCSRGIRVTAIDCLLRDGSFDLPDDLKKLVLDQFPQEIEVMIGSKKLTKDLEDLIADPKIFPSTKDYANLNLRSGYYRTSNSTNQ